MPPKPPDQPRVERPRHEPEIIPPRRNDGAYNDLSGIFIRVDEADGMRRVYLRRPGPISIALGLLAVGFVAALMLILIAGMVLVWVPVIVGLVFATMFAFWLRRRWRLLRAWWSGAPYR